jgi:hypothetical protein
MNSIGQTKLTEILPHLNLIANQYGLKLYKPNEFKLAKLILIAIYFHCDIILE